MKYELFRTKENFYIKMENNIYRCEVYIDDNGEPVVYRTLCGRWFEELVIQENYIDSFESQLDVYNYIKLANMLE